MPRNENAGPPLPKMGCVFFLLLLPRFLGLLMVIVVIVGILLLSPFPSLSRQNEVELTDVLLRAIDDHRIDPLFYLQSWRAWGKVAVQFPSGEKLQTVQKGPHQFEHRKASATGGDETASDPITTTTPHTKIPIEDLDHARKQLDLLFPPTDRERREQIRQWGENLYLIWWDFVKWRFQIKHDIEPANGTEDEHLWFAWQRLRADIPEADADLPDLLNLTRKAYESEEDQRAALKWAREFHVRLTTLRTISIPFKHEAGVTPRDPLQTTTIPPASDWTDAWLLYTHVGLTEASRQAAEERCRKGLRDDRANFAIQWGQDIQVQREKAGEALPPVRGDAVAWLCTFERRLGLDPYGIRCRQIVWDELGVSSSKSSFVQLTILHGGVPNDEIYYLAATDDPFNLFPYGVRARQGFRCLMLFCFLLGIRFWVFSVIGDRLLGLRNDKRYTEFRDRRRFSFSVRRILALVALLLTPVLGWGLAHLDLPLLVRASLTPTELLAEVYLSVLLGGGLFLFISQLCAVILFRLGLDPESSWLDEIISIPLGILLLLYFQNEVWSIASYVLLALIPEVILRVGRERHS